MNLHFILLDHLATFRTLLGDLECLIVKVNEESKVTEDEGTTEEPIFYLPVTIALVGEEVEVVRGKP